MPLFLCRRWPAAGRGGKARRWPGCGRDKLTDYDMPPADKPLIPLLRDFLMTNPTACLLVIGNEVLSGRTQDANIKFLATGLGEIGIPLREVRVIPDVPETIIATVNEVPRPVRPRVHHRRHRPDP